jgi:hypothetical protein
MARTERSTQVKHLLLLLVTLLLSLLPSHPHARHWPIDVAPIYRPLTLEMSGSSANPTRARVESPEALKGAFIYVMAPFTGPNFVNLTCVTGQTADCRVRYTMRLLHSLDDQYACKVNHSRTDADEPIDANTMLLVQRAGGCFFGTKAQNVQAIGAGVSVERGETFMLLDFCVLILARSCLHLMQGYHASRLRSRSAQQLCERRGDHVLALEHQHPDTLHAVRRCNADAHLPRGQE